MSRINLDLGSRHIIHFICNDIYNISSNIYYTVYIQLYIVGEDIKNGNLNFFLLLYKTNENTF